MIDKLSLKKNNTYGDLINLEPIQSEIKKEKDKKTSTKN